MQPKLSSSVVELEELLHELLRVHAALEVDRELEAVQVRLVAHVGDLADLAGLDQLRDLVNDDLGRGRVGDLVDLNEIPFPDVAPAGADAEAAAAGLVDLQHLRRVVEDLAAGREIRRGQQSRAGLRRDLRSERWPSRRPRAD